MGLVKVFLFLLKTKIIHFGEIYRLISFHYFFSKQKLDISELRILDVGFNKGVYRWYFTDFHSCSHYSGIEINRKFLDIYPDTFYHNFEKNELHKNYDLILCSHVLEHVSNDYQFLYNLTHSLNDKNGKLFLRVPMPTDEKIFFRSFNAKHQDDEEHKRDGYNPSELIILLTKVGLKVEKYFFNMGRLSLALHTLFEIFRDYQIRFQRVFQIPYILVSMIDIYLINKTSNSDLLILAVKESKKSPS